LGTRLGGDGSVGLLDGMHAGQHPRQFGRHIGHERYLRYLGQRINVRFGHRNGIRLDERHVWHVGHVVYWGHLRHVGFVHGRNIGNERNVRHGRHVRIRLFHDPALNGILS
jgi:hypothetical protein